ncbi:MAG: peptidylprolyl isomerase [Candidatus Nanopelagicaceae bacterium]|jgi:peptidyl-prolyl cis-trans isomerase B (cyclophilin B)
MKFGAVIEMKKRIGFALVVALLLPTMNIYFAAADEHRVSKVKVEKANEVNKSSKSAKNVKCESTTAIGHAPVDVPIPDRVMTARQVARAMKQIILETNCGEIVIQPNYRARVALTAMNALIRGGFYDMSLCHRLTTEGIYVLQCGDPTATGRGGPNFTYGVENLPTASEDNYPEGVVAIANSGTANSNGSQFFIVYEDTTLPPNYTIFGRVIKGLDIVKMIARAGVKDGSGDGTPKQTIAIERAFIR